MWYMRCHVTPSPSPADALQEAVSFCEKMGWVAEVGAASQPAAYGAGRHGRTGGRGSGRALLPPRHGRSTCLLRSNWRASCEAHAPPPEKCRPPRSGERVLQHTHGALQQFGGPCPLPCPPLLWTQLAPCCGPAVVEQQLAGGRGHKRMACSFGGMVCKCTCLHVLGSVQK